MKSVSTLNVIIALILSAIAYFALPDDFIPVQVSFIFGLLIGAAVIPQLAKLITETSAESLSPAGTTTLYVGNLPYKANEDAVSDHFSQFGNVASVRLMKDRRTGKRRGYGFVEVDSKSAEKVIKKLNDTDFQERTLKVCLAKEKQEHE